MSTDTQARHSDTSVRQCQALLTDEARAQCQAVSECTDIADIADTPTPRHLHDPKGLFVFRWYKEVDAAGKVPNGRRYQNPGCKAYELCSFNDGDRFCWTAQAQLISKVYLKKHPTLPRCYTLNAKDKKMVNEFWKARVRG